MDQDKTSNTDDADKMNDTSDPWIARADALKARMEQLLEVQLHEYEVMHAKLQQWKEHPEQPWLTADDYAPWQKALADLDAAHRDFDAHISTRVKK